ncbi:MAG: CRISPR-associated protein Cas5 [Thaumarchaeota archaeon]|nr:CRISPR-associated protein Cas5 [Nitrososphaerota archaeon]MCL5319165.1 CRISPR-associated protein Cas5 [Nitrososphaerota archaeon]
MKALHIVMEGLTASFRYPLVISGTQISTPMPAYSTILGLISACVGRIVTQKDTDIGFEFRSKSLDLELERTERLQLKRGALKPHSEGQGISKRQVHFEPKLDLYLTNTQFRSAFESPVSTPCLGRSQDLMWIKDVREVDLSSTAKGAIGPTLLSVVQEGIPGLIVRLPEWFENDLLGRPRMAGPFGKYLAMPPNLNLRITVEIPNLYHPSDANGADDAIYIHQWLE